MDVLGTGDLQLSPDAAPAFAPALAPAQEPGKYIDPLISAGASSITFQVEPFLAAPGDAAALAAVIRRAGLRAAVALGVDTPVEHVLPLVAARAVDMVRLLGGGGGGLLGRREARGEGGAVR